MSQQRYKQICGIYKITNLINFKIYIGQSVNIYQRWHAHKYADCKDSIIHRAIKKYGIQNFQFEIIEECNKQKLNQRERYWIQYYDSYNSGYNLTPGGDGHLDQRYEKILELWNNGNNCEQITKILLCDDKTVTKALHYFNITQEEIRARSNRCQGKPVVAIDMQSLKPLKIFSNCSAVNDFFKGIYKSINLKKYIENNYKYEGYYWQYLNDNNYPQCNLTDEEFLQYQKDKKYTRSKELIEQISLNNRKVERCSRDQLKKLIRSIPFLQIGKKFNVSDNAIRKWCDYYNLPRRVKDIKQYSDEEWEKL